MIINQNSNDLGIWNSNASPNFFDSGVDLPPIASATRWQHIAAVGTATATRLYIDGRLVASINQGVSGNFYAIGNFQLGGQQFANQIDEVAIYNQALSDTQIASIYSQFAVGIPTDSDSFGLQGDIPNEQLYSLVPVGDFNGDKRDDFLVKGRTFSYLAFGPLDLTDLESVRDRANIVITNSALGTPGDRFGDVNGDGFADLAFLKTFPSVEVNVVFGGPVGAHSLEPPYLGRENGIVDLWTRSLSGLDLAITREE